MAISWQRLQIPCKSGENDIRRIQELLPNFGRPSGWKGVHKNGSIKVNADSEKNALKLSQAAKDSKSQRNQPKGLNQTNEFALLRIIVIAIESVNSLVEIWLYLICIRVVMLHRNTIVQWNVQIKITTLEKFQLKLRSIALFFRQYFFVLKPLLASCFVNPFDSRFTRENNHHQQIDKLWTVMMWKKLRFAFSDFWEPVWSS